MEIQEKGSLQLESPGCGVTRPLPPSPGTPKETARCRMETRDVLNCAPPKPSRSFGQEEEWAQHGGEQQPMISLQLLLKGKQGTDTGHRPPRAPAGLRARRLHVPSWAAAWAQILRDNALPSSLRPSVQRRCTTQIKATSSNCGGDKQAQHPYSNAAAPAPSRPKPRSFSFHRENPPAPSQAVEGPQPRLHPQKGLCILPETLREGDV